MGTNHPGEIAVLAEMSTRISCGYEHRLGALEFSVMKRRGQGKGALLEVLRETATAGVLTRRQVVSRVAARTNATVVTWASTFRGHPRQ